MPAKDYRGAPFYAYFFALLAASHDYELHSAPDVLSAGASQTWMEEPLPPPETRPDVLASNPLPGPPTADGTLRSQMLRREPGESPAFRSPALSTRLFILDRRRITNLRIERPTAREAFGARLDGNPPFLPAEGVISRAMARSGLGRMDFLGDQPGMWGVH